MSQRAVIIVLALAAVLSFITWYVVSGSGRPVATAAALLPADFVDRITVVEVQPAGEAGAAPAAKLTVRRTAAPLPELGVEWLLEDGGSVWPVDTARVRAALRLLTELADATSAATGATGDTGDMGEGTTVRLSTPTETRTVVFSSLSLGGRSVAKVSGPEDPGAAAGGGKAASQRRWCDERLPRVFEAGGIRLWRQTRLLPRDGAAYAGLAVGSGEKRLELRRVRGVWSVTTPRALRANDEQAAAALGAVSGATVRRFIEDADTRDPVYGFEQPAGVLTVIQDRRDPADAARVETITEVVEVGNPADVARQTVFVRVTATLSSAKGESRVWGPMVGVAERGPLDQIPIDPLHYASLAAVRIPAADVVEVSLQRLSTEDFSFDSTGGPAVALTRTLDGFARKSQDSPPVPLTRPDRENLNRWLTLLTTASAEVNVAGVPEGTKPLAAITLGAAGAPGERVVLGLAEVGGKPVLVAGSDGLYRLYTGESLTEMISWLVAKVGEAG